jgi:predicted XRE-type DNA-binding protein
MRSKHRKESVEIAADAPLEMKQGSGNIFADLGFPDAANHLVKAGLVAEMDRVIQQKGLTRKEAAVALGIEPSKLAEMLVGHFREYSVERLMGNLVALGVDVEITVKPKEHEAAELRVA